MNTLSLKLPRAIEANEKKVALESLLTQDLRVLWEGGKIEVPHVSFSPRLESMLIESLRFQHLERGLENIEKILEREKRGLNSLQEKQGTSPANRISRVLIIASDGTERFFRSCETILYRHSDRVLGIRIDAPSDLLSINLFGSEKQVKAVLVSDRDATTRVLLSLLPL